MSYEQKSKTAKVILPSDSSYWVEVKVGLKYGELKRFYEYGGSEAPFTTIEKLKLSIIEWNLDAKDGSILPINEESIDKLQEDDVIAIADAATPKKESPEVKKNSAEQSSATSTAQK